MSEPDFHREPDTDLIIHLPLDIALAFPPSHKAAVEARSRETAAAVGARVSGDP